MDSSLRADSPAPEKRRRAQFTTSGNKITFRFQCTEVFEKHVVDLASSTRSRCSTATARRRSSRRSRRGDKTRGARHRQRPAGPRLVTVVVVRLLGRRLSALALFAVVRRVSGAVMSAWSRSRVFAICASLRTETSSPATASRLQTSIRSRDDGRRISRRRLCTRAIAASQSSSRKSSATSRSGRSGTRWRAWRRLRGETIREWLNPGGNPRVVLTGRLAGVGSGQEESSRVLDGRGAHPHYGRPCSSLSASLALVRMRSSVCCA